VGPQRNSNDFRWSFGAASPPPRGVGAAQCESDNPHDSSTPAFGDRTAFRERIQGARAEWLALGHDGKKSAFVILGISPLLAHAVPDATVQSLAQELCAS
jgi:hypothetical protein